MTMEADKGEAELLIESYLEKEGVSERRDDLIYDGGGGGGGGEEEEEEEEEGLVPGFRFHPTDEELVGFYLQKKVAKKRLSIDIIKEIDVYKYNPWDLAKQSNYGLIGEKESYFFCQREKKYRNSVRPNRVTDSGYWKATGIDKRIIFPPGSGTCIGLKKSLVYYCGKGGKGTKTYWMMHEFRLLPPMNKVESCSKEVKCGTVAAEKWTICKIFQRNVVSFPKISPPEEERRSTITTDTDRTDPTMQLILQYCSRDQNLSHVVPTSDETSSTVLVSNHEPWGDMMTADHDVLPSSVDDLYYPIISSPIRMDDFGYQI